MGHQAWAQSDEYSTEAPRDGLPLPPRPVPIRRDPMPTVEAEEHWEVAPAPSFAELARALAADRPPRAGRRRSTPTDRPEGRYVRASPLCDGTDVALDATLRAAAPWQRERRMAHAGRRLAIHVAHEDLRQKRRTRRVGRLLVLVVDLSGSMAHDLMVLARRAAACLLREAYLKRDRVAMVAFRERSAEVVFGPTSCVELARRRLEDLPTGGKTPLAFGLTLGLRLCERALDRDPHVEPVLVVISDGKANVGSRAGYPAVLAEIERITARLRGERRVRKVLFDATEEGKNEQPGRRLAESLDAARLPVHRLRGLDAAALAALLARL